MVQGQGKLVASAASFACKDGYGRGCSFVWGVDVSHQRSLYWVPSLIAATPNTLSGVHECVASVSARQLEAMAMVSAWCFRCVASVCVRMHHVRTCRRVHSAPLVSFCLSPDNRHTRVQHDALMQA